MSKYHDYLKDLTDINISDVLAANNLFFTYKGKIDKLYDDLERGVAILDCEEQLMAYINLYGHQHIAKLYRAFSKLPNDIVLNSTINIIDYGCGQALGTMCYAEFRKSKNPKQHVNSVTLIEPSVPCLERAEFHTRLFFPQASINLVNKVFDDLTPNDIYCDHNIPTLHVFSNVLDMKTFDIIKMTDLIDKCVKGYNYFVCVSPYHLFSNMSRNVKYLVNKLQGTIVFRESTIALRYNSNKYCASDIICFNVHK